MAYSIYGDYLRPGHCEVHPYIHQDYPCSQCCREQRENAEAKRAEEAYYREMEEAYQRDLERAEAESWQGLFGDGI